jgi:hypothetical protein
VKPSSPDRVQLFVEDLADLVVGEDEGVVAAGDQKLCRHRRVERVQESVFPLVAGDRLQLAELERLPQHGGRPEHVGRFLRNTIQTVADRRLHALRDRQILQVVARPAVLVAPHGALVDERLQDLFHEERVPLGLAVHRRREVDRDLFAHQRHQELARLLGREALQGDARREPLAVPVHERRRERMRAVELHLAVRGGEQHALVAQAAQQVAHQPQRARIGPVQVVDVEQNPACPGRIAQHVRDRVHEQELFLVGRQRRVFGEGAEPRRDLRRQLRQARSAVAQRRAQAVVVRLVPHEATEGLGEREVRRRGFVFVASAGEHQAAVERRLDQELLREACLTRARLAADEKQVARPVAGARPQLARFGQLLGAADELSPCEGIQDRDAARGIGGEDGVRILDRLFQSDTHLGGGGVPLGRLLRQQLHHDRFDRRRNRGHDRAWWDDRCVDVLADHLERARADEREPARQKLVEHDAQRIEIRAAVHRLTHRLLGRHVRHRPDDRPRIGHATPSARAKGDAEVGQLHGAAVHRPRQEDVLGLEVAMHDPVRVGMLERLADAHRHAHHPGEIGRRLRVQIRSRHQLHDEEWNPRVLADVVHRDDCRVVQRRGRARFAQQPFARLGRRRRRRQHLHRDLALELEVGRAEHDPHAAASQLGVEAIAAPERRAGRQPGNRGAVERACLFELRGHAAETSTSPLHTRHACGREECPQRRASRQPLPTLSTTPRTTEERPHARTPAE